MVGDLPRLARVCERIEENEEDVTLRLEAPVSFTPGQFLMVWMPGVNEKPYSIAGGDGKSLLLTVRPRGPFSEQLAKLGVGAPVWIRGPYGKGFQLVENCCLIAGGVGFAALAPLADLYPKAPILYGEDTARRWMYRTAFPPDQLLRDRRERWKVGLSYQ